ncbi:MAG: hypothetical protein ACI3YT_02720 [Prevotella sp.]
MKELHSMMLSMAKVKAVIMSNPWTFAASAIITLISVMVDLTRKTDELSSRQKLLNDVNKLAQGCH